MARKADELGEALFFLHIPPGTFAEHRWSAPSAPDLQSSEPEVRIGLSRAGVRGVNKAIRLRRGRNEKLVFAEISCSVDLDPAQRGVHMSRFPELFEQAIDEL